MSLDPKFPFTSAPLPRGQGTPPAPLRGSWSYSISRLAAALAAGAVLLAAFAGVAGVPGVEKLLPEDTLVLVTAPDFSRLSQVGKRLPQVQCWNDPAIKPFREKFLANFKEQFVQPLERELGVKVADYTGLLQGQVTFALTQNGWQGQDNQSPAMLLLIDSGDKSAQLKKDLAELRKKWVEAGKSLRTEKVSDIEFTILLLSSNDVPKTWRKFFPPSPQVQEIGDPNQTKKPPAKSELVIGQAESLLIAGSSLPAVQRVVGHLRGGSAPALGDLDAYQANRAALFRDSPLYAWVNAKALVELLNKAAAQKQDNPDAPDPFDLKPEKILGALGFSSLKTVAASLQDSPEGELLQVFFDVPESGRKGLFKLLAGEPRETAPPPFVPADAVKFQRWRLDGQKTWAALQQVLADISPQAIGTVNFLLDSANANAQQTEAGFDIRKNLFGNLGNDFITYEKRPADDTSASGPSLLLVGSPNPQQLAGSLQSILVYVTQQLSVAPAEREFLGRKIFTVKVRPLGMSMGGGAGTPFSLSYAASGGYVALSTDVALLEEYLRSAESQARPLRQTAGLSEAMQKVLGPDADLAGYQNDREIMRAVLGALRKQAGSSTNGTQDPSGSSGAGSLSLAGATAAVKDWADYPLLPPFETLAKYFYFSVYGGSATTEGLSFKMFEPTPPALRTVEAKR
jgi:hypothetical protein